MPSAKSEVSIGVEVLSSLHLCNVTIYWPEPITKEEIRQVISDSTSFIIKFTNGSILKVNNPKSVQYSPGEQSFVITKDMYIQIRLQLDLKSKALSSICSDLASDIRSLYIKSPQEALRGVPMLMSCSGCENILSDMVEFKRIQEMPATDWNHSLEEWFCHAHESAFDNLKPGAIAPKTTDCFFTEFFFLVTRDLLLASRYNVDCNNNVVCSECNNIFGVICKTGVKLWSHKIQWKSNNEERSVVYGQNAQDVLISLIDNVSVDKLGPNSRLAFEKPSTPKLFLCLTVMDSNLTLLSAAKNKLSHKEELSLPNHDAENSKTDHTCAQFKRLNIAKRTRPELFVNGLTELNLNKTKVVKVLYKFVSGETDETESWADDVNVQLLPCAESLFDILYEMLEDSRVSVMSDGTDHQDLQTAYIPRN